MESKAQADAARDYLQWTKALDEDAKPKQAQWYLIKVDGVSRDNIYKKIGDG